MLAKVVAAVVAAAMALLCTFVGLWAAFRYDLPANHLVAVATCAYLVLAGLACLVARAARPRIEATQGVTGKSTSSD